MVVAAARIERRRGERIEEVEVVKVDDVAGFGEARERSGRLSPWRVSFLMPAAAG